jgi:hypothetical protein
VRQDDLDRALGDDGLEPSSGFALRVMEAVRQAAQEPPLRFPWLRFALGALASTLFAGAGAFLLVSSAPVIDGVLAAPSFAAALPQLAAAALGAALAFAARGLPRLFSRS